MGKNMCVLDMAIDTLDLQAWDEEDVQGYREHSRGGAGGYVVGVYLKVAFTERLRLPQEASRMGDAEGRLHLPGRTREFASAPMGGEVRSGSSQPVHVIGDRQVYVASYMEIDPN